MRLESLTLKNFRNYGALEIQFSPRINVLIGKNGQGKTNLLEAVLLLSQTKSNRTGTDRELIQSGQLMMALNAWVKAHQYESTQQIQVQMTLGDNARLKTVFKKNASPLRSRSQLLGTLPSVSFFLSDLLLLRGTPDDRRKWLDAAIIQYDRRHLEKVAAFQKIRQQKNQLLKNPPHLVNPEHLMVWNEKFAEAGARLMAARVQYLSMIHDWVTVKYQELSNHQETLAFEYQHALTLKGSFDEGLQESVIKEALQLKLTEVMSNEIRRGTSLVGPHRDDISFFINGLNAASYGSQGQQRTVVLALKLVELSVLTNKLSEPPVLLMDDVMAELDPDRQRALIEHVHPESQVFLTTTHLDEAVKQLLHDWLMTSQLTDKLPAEKTCRVFSVKQGTVKEEVLIETELTAVDLPVFNKEQTITASLVSSVAEESV